MRYNSTSRRIGLRARNAASNTMRLLNEKKSIVVRPYYLVLLLFGLYLWRIVITAEVDIGPASLFHIFTGNQRYNSVDGWSVFDAAEREFAPVPSSSVNRPRYLVIYSGPTVGRNVRGGVHELYSSNFEFFLKYGLHPHSSYAAVDFAIVLTNASLPYWKPLIMQIGMENVHLLVRRPECYDMQSYMTALKRFDYKKYDRIIAVNCGLKGPFLPPYIRNFAPWTSLLAGFIDDQVKFAGLSQNGEGIPADVYQRHVQSMMWVTDPIGMRVILDAGCMFDCTQPISGRSSNRDYLIQRYEIGMSVAIKRANYSIRAWNNYQLNKQYCNDYKSAVDHYRETYPYGPEFSDEWFPRRYFSRASPYESMFIKVTRKLTYGKDDVDQAPAHRLGQCDKRSMDLNQAFYNKWLDKYVTPR